MTGVGASSSRKRKPVHEVEEAIAKAMESGRAGLAEDAGEDTRIALFVKGRCRKQQRALRRARCTRRFLSGA